MDEYTIVEDGNYIMQELEAGSLHPVRAVKIGKIKARKGIVGEKITTWSTDENGNELIEKVNEVTLDPNTGRPAWVVTKTDYLGNVIIDKNGHPNEWIISDSDFIRKYEKDKVGKDIFKPKRQIQIFDRVDRNIVLVNHGKKMKISKGGFINLSNPDGAYGVSKRDFEDTYRIEQTSKTI